MAIFLVPRRAKPCSAAVSTFAFLFVVTLAPGPSDAAPKVVVKPKAAGKATKAVAAPPEPATLPLVPLPKKVTVKPGTFTFGSGTRIQAPVPLRAIAERFRADLVPST